MNNDALGDRMKNYENSFRSYLPRRIPVIIRVDGCHFHSYTKQCKKPFDDDLIHVMNETAMFLCQNIHGAQIAYVQSDEISILINNYMTLHTQPWFNNNLQKMASVSAGMASAIFTSKSNLIFKSSLPENINPAYFDSRIFLLPKEEVNNYFLWRQKDCSRNSVQMLARSLYFHKELNNKNNSQLQEMIYKKGLNWNNLPTSYKRGRCIIKQTFKIEDSEILRSKWIIDNDIPIFNQDVNYINKFLEAKE